jgi:hypothetical protein
MVERIRLVSTRYLSVSSEEEADEVGDVFVAAPLYVMTPFVHRRSALPAELTEPAFAPSPHLSSGSTRRDRRVNASTSRGWEASSF